MFQRSETACYRCVRWIDKESRPALVMGYVNAGQSNREGRFTLSNTGDEWLVHAVPRTIRGAARGRPSAVYGSFHKDRSSFKTSLHFKSCVGRSV